MQANVGYQQTTAIRPQDAQQMRTGGCKHGGFLRHVQPGGQHHRSARAKCPQLCDQTRHCRGWRANHGQFGHGRQIGSARKDRLAVKLAILRVDRVHRALEVAVASVAPYRSAHAGWALRGAKHRYRCRIE